MSNKVKRTFSSYITNNLALKLFSVIFAIILWSFVINDTNPLRTKVLREIPIKITGIEELENMGLTLRDDYGEQLFATVRASVSHSDFRRISKDMVSASVDVSKIASEGTYDIPVNVLFANNTDIALLSTSPANISVKVDPLVSADVPLNVVTKGVLANGLVSVAPVYPETVRISGSNFYIDKIAKAVLEVDLSTLDDGDIFSAPCTFYNALENEVAFKPVSVTADMDIQSTKTVKIDLSGAVKNTNKVASGYQYDGIDAPSVTICAHAGILKDITSVSALAVDLSGKNAEFTQAPLELKLPEGVSLLPGAEAPVATIKIIEAQSTLSVKRKVTVKLGSNSATISANGYTYSVKADGTTNLNATVVLSGSASALEKIYSNDVSVTLDVTSLEKGTHTLTLQPHLNSALDNQITAQISSPVSVKVTIK